LGRIRVAAFPQLAVVVLAYMLGGVEDPAHDVVERASAHLRAPRCAQEQQLVGVRTRAGAAIGCAQTMIAGGEQTLGLGRLALERGQDLSERGALQVVLGCRLVARIPRMV